MSWSSSSLGLNSTRNSPSVNVLPAQRSLLLADSKYRKRNISTDEDGNRVQDETNDESPYDFQANFSSAIVGKEIIYQKLYWCQPIYAHNNASCELRFQINGDDTTTYVVYAIPFVMYTQYDGNPPGVPWGIPQQYSYADMMQLGFNGDVRLLNSNLQLTVPPPPETDYGYLYDADGFKMTVKFRYSPTQGFVISFGPSINPAIPVYTIRLLPCSYIAKAHFTHGFGIYDATVSETDFVPRNNWTVAYFSDDTPNLMPFRYVTVRSPELTKDRRMISFQSANSNRISNEISIIALNPAYTGTYHTENVGDDATVVSKRDDYQPQVARIIISGEDGEPILCDSPISNLLQTPGIVNDTVKNSFLFGPRAGRGDVVFVNDIVFGAATNQIAPINPLGPVQIPQSIVPSPLGVIGYVGAYQVAPVVSSQKSISINFWAWYISAASTNMFRQVIPIITNPTGGPVSFPPSPDSYTYAGVNSSVQSQNPYTIFGTPSNNPIPPNVSVFLWDPKKNSAPVVGIDAHIYAAGFDGVHGDQTKFSNVYTYVIGYSYDLEDIILASYAVSGLSFYPALGFVDFYAANDIQLYRNPNYSNLIEPQRVAFYFFFANSLAGNPTIPGTVNVAFLGMNFATAVPPVTPIFRFKNPNLVTTTQPQYISPAVNSDANSTYEFGNPQAAAKCEELIHELVLVLDKN